MNIECFVGPLDAGTTGIDPQLTGMDRIADALIYVLIQGEVLHAVLTPVRYGIRGDEQARRRRRPRIHAVLFTTQLRIVDNRTHPRSIDLVRGHIGAVRTDVESACR